MNRDTPTPARETREIAHWHESADVVIVGLGCVGAGATAGAAGGVAEPLAVAVTEIVVDGVLEIAETP